MQALKEAHPFYNAYYKNIVKAEQTGDNEVTFAFSEKGNRELPLITGQMPVLPKHWWTGKDTNGKARDIRETTLEVPLGSGAYMASEVKPGASIRMKRVADYWAKDLPVQVGQDNFDEIEYIYFRDANVAFEAFKGDQFDWRTENSSKMWATGYDFPAIASGRAVKEEIQLKQVEGMQSWALNIRRPKFRDVRVRQALNYAFDFEWANTNLFYGQYARSRSYFNNSEMEAKGLPSPEELAILEPLKDKLPPEVFTAEYTNPVNDTPQNRRKNMRQAAKLLDEAGWKVTQDGGKSVIKNDKGERLTVEFLLDSPLFERIALPISNNSNCWASASASRRWTARNTSVRSRPSTMTSSSAIGASRSHPATSSAISGGARLPPATAAATMWASRTPPSTSWSRRLSSRPTARAW